MSELSWEEMVQQVVIDGRPGDVRSAALGWQELLKNLGQVQESLKTNVTDLGATWEGTGYDEFKKHVELLASSIGTVVANVNEGDGIVNSLNNAADKLQNAQANMPVPLAMTDEIMAARDGRLTLGIGSFEVKVKPSFLSWGPMNWGPKMHDWLFDQTEDAQKVYNGIHNEYVYQAADMPGDGKGKDIRDPNPTIPNLDGSGGSGAGAGGFGGGGAGSGGLPSSKGFSPSGGIGSGGIGDTGTGSYPGSGSGSYPGSGAGDYTGGTGGSGTYPGTGSGGYPGGSGGTGYDPSEYGTGLAGAGGGGAGAGGLGSGLGGGLGGGSGLGGGTAGLGSTAGLGGGAGGAAAGAIPGGGALGKPVGTGAGPGMMGGGAGAGAGKGGAGKAGGTKAGSSLRAGGGAPGAGGAAGSRGGAGYGEDGQERNSWLQEDEDVWGTGGDLPPGVLR
ncbi:WXG100 family type VII secretion target [Actinoplanes awajinensis]|uniref:PPE family domain-containing protein n=1 Tax=Actinoplanes awajinensis subsp. mycoplanecinus TaxID=135947 RepID=A0A101JLP9_9ACTN|nr:hypothetical protein [Actinoplanes awajinensis]KUL29175.1 hypothetical protein ADL15_28855 [Actinoplanes awajinensis subsp. mycoplanecinus]